MRSLILENVTLKLEQFTPDLDPTFFLRHGVARARVRCF